MDLILEDAKNRNLNYSPSTISSFKRHLIKLNDGKEFNDCSFLLDAPKIVKKIDAFKNKRDETKFLSSQTKKFYYTAICALLRTSTGNGDILKIYGNKILEYKNQYVEERENETVKDLENFESSENLKKLVLEPLKEQFYKILKKKKIGVRDCEVSQYAVLASCYLLQPPLRCDWATLKIAFKDEHMPDTNNYLVLDFQGTPICVVLNNYKTSSAYGKSVHPIQSKDLSKILRDFVNSKPHHFMNTSSTEDIDDKDFDYLFHGYSRRANQFIPMTTNALSKVIPQIFKNENQKKRITINLLRKIWATEHSDRAYYDKVKETSKQMCHSVGTHMTHYHKG